MSPTRVGSDAVLEHLLAEKAALEITIEGELKRLYPDGARVTYKTNSMKHERFATVSGSGASLYHGSPYVTLKPDHALKKPWRRLHIATRYVSVL